MGAEVRAASRIREALPSKALAIVAALTSLALSLGAAASVAAPLSFDALYRRADLVVEGRVQRVTSRTRAARGRMVVETLVSLEVTEVHRGAAVPELVFTLPGGRLGERRRVVVGTPTVRPHEEVVAFLESHEGALRLVGLAQGLYRVNRLRDGRAHAVRDLRDVALHRAGALEHGERESMPLADLRAKLRRAGEAER